MQTLTTDKGQTFEIDFAASSFDGSVTIMMKENRLLSEIAPDFEGINHMEYYVDSELQNTFDGYSVLSAIIRTDIRNKVQISVKKPTGGD